MSSALTITDAPRLQPVDPPAVLLVDDEPQVLRALQRVFRASPWRTALADSPGAALAFLEAHPVAVVVSDFHMPGLSGVELLRKVRERWPETQRILLTGQVEAPDLQEAINQSEVFRFVAKPWREADLLAAVAQALEVVALRQENERLLRLSMEQNATLAELNGSLEQKILARTEAYAQAQREWAAAFDALGTPLAIVDGEYQVRRANRAWTRDAGLSPEDVLGKPCLAQRFGEHAPCPGCTLGEALNARRSVERELDLGDRMIVVSAHPWPDPAEALAVVTYRDVTEERRTDAWRLQTARLAAVGRLAGGVAHELNNPLSGVLAFAQLMKKGAHSPDDTESLQLIEESALRCKHIVESLLRFAGVPGESALQHVDLRRITRDTVTLFRSQIKRRPGAELGVADEPESLPAVLADPHALSQTLMDLLHHRLRALPAEGGTLTLALTSDPVFVGWELTDDAPPIDAHELERLADPALTDQLGLGLAFRLAGELGGRLEVLPNAVRGNRFLLRLKLPGTP